MNNTKTWMALTGLVVVLSGLIIYSTLQAKATDRKQFLAKIQDLNAQIVELSKLRGELEQANREKEELRARSQSDISALEAQISDGKKAEASLRVKVEALIKEKDTLTKYSDNNSAIIAKLKRKLESLQEEGKGGAQTSDSGIAGPHFVDPMEDERSGSDGAPPPVVRNMAQDVIDLGRILIKKSTKQPASVDHVNTLYGVIVLSAGSNDGLHKDSVVNITRNNRLIAKAVVKKVRLDVSTAVTLPEWTREEIKVGDLVSINDSSR